MKHFPRKRFGQHFLVDQFILQSIVRSINTKPNDHLVEIGPGQAALTDYLVKEVQQLDVIEIDRDLIAPLKERFSGYSGFKVHQADALDFDFKSLQTGTKKLRVVGNLPYNISTPLLFHLFDELDCIEDMHFLLQKEVVERLCAPPNDEHYGRLSVMAQYYCQCSYLFEVGPEAFDPPPKVDSAVIRLVPQVENRLVAKDPARLSVIVREAFNQRRKTLANSLKQLISGTQLEELGIDPKRRAQELSVAEFVKISNQLNL
ncbi:MAG TPA: 16S rRNA (adenine(1518)-N(6)/adenine(1519)-N(6))-dimethyltransferase RsmA [Coxiellaceae bacterium]|nr:16S rRNA (adenine(1518)-N(6)/adenine(1519)-N(6))-dimethyltransferase RsmA [Coxiellaceae bacterium]